MEVSSIDWESAYRSVRRWVTRSVPSGEVEDVVQEVMLSATPLLESHDGQRSKLTTLLYTISKRRVADYHRGVRVDFVPLGDHEAATDVNPLGATESDEMLGVLMRLPARDKEVLYFHHWLGMGFQEISDNRGLRYPLSAEAVRSRYRRARDLFAFELSRALPGGVDISAAKSLQARICALPDCGHSFVPSWRGRTRKFCTDGCAQKSIERQAPPEAYFERECAIAGCTVVFKPSNSGRNGLQKYCSGAHKVKAHRLRKKSRERTRGGEIS